ncbi:MAG: tRNA (adenosine(37)-N6)-threonylcarbamoyltransferase complex dimerization subunit type 1 TsaB [Thalassobaculaceae bacterium]
MSVLLALDCAAGACSVAVVEAGDLRGYGRIDLARGHAEALMPLVDRVLAEAGCDAADLAAIAATVGPGSFTGLRIGLAAARGLALAVGARTVPVTSLEAIAHEAFRDEPADGDAESGLPLLVGLDTKRGDLYAQWFEPSGRPVGYPAVLTAADAIRAAPGSSVRLAGDGAPALAAAAQEAGLTVSARLGPTAPDARSVAAIGERRLARGEDGPLRPLYLRAPAVNLSAS